MTLVGGTDGTTHPGAPWRLSGPCVEVQGCLRSIGPYSLGQPRLFLGRESFLSGLSSFCWSSATSSWRRICPPLPLRRSPRALGLYNGNSSRSTPKSGKNGWSWPKLPPDFLAWPSLRRLQFGWLFVRSRADRLLFFNAIDWCGWFGCLFTDRCAITVVLSGFGGKAWWPNTLSAWPQCNGYSTPQRIGWQAKAHSSEQLITSRCAAPVLAGWFSEAERLAGLPSNPAIDIDAERMYWAALASTHKPA